MILLLTIGLAVVFAVVLELASRRLKGRLRGVAVALLLTAVIAAYYFVHVRMVHGILILGLVFNSVLIGQWPRKEPRRITAEDLRLNAKPVDPDAWPPSPTPVGQHDAAITGIVFRNNSDGGATIEEIASELAADTGLAYEDAVFAVREYALRRVRGPVAFAPYAYLMLVLLTLCISFILRYVMQTSIAVASIAGSAMLVGGLSIAVWLALSNRRRRR